MSRTTNTSSSSLTTTTTNITKKNGVKTITTERNTTTDINSVSSANYTFTRILSIVLCILIVIALLRSLTGAEPLYFSSFLESLGNAPTVNWIVPASDMTIGGSWGIFDFLRNLFNMFAEIFSVITFLVSGFANLIIFATYFLRTLFWV